MSHMHTTAMEFPTKAGQRVLQKSRLQFPNLRLVMNEYIAAFCGLSSMVAMSSVLDGVSPDRQLACFTHWCSSNFGFVSKTRSKAIRGTVVWCIRVFPSRLVVFSKRRKRSFDAQISVDLDWPDRLQIVYRLWRDVTNLDFRPVALPVVPFRTKQRWISLLDLGLVISVLWNDESIQMEFPSTLHVHHGSCRPLMTFQPPRAQLSCASCGIFLGGPKVVQKSHRFGPVEEILQFCMSSLQHHRKHFVSEYSPLQR